MFVINAVRYSKEGIILEDTQLVARRRGSLKIYLIKMWPMISWKTTTHINIAAATVEINNIFNLKMLTVFVMNSYKFNKILIFSFYFIRVQSL